VTGPGNVFLSAADFDLLLRLLADHDETCDFFGCHECGLIHRLELASRWEVAS
jgi:hypothetical protein